VDQFQVAHGLKSDFADMIQSFLMISLVNQYISAIAEFRE